MSPLLPAPLLAPVVIPLLGLVGQPPADEAAVQVAPEQIAFSAGTRVRTVTLTNESDEPLYLRVVPRAWRQSPRGEAELAATTDLVSVPSSVTLRPGESRPVNLLPTRGPGAIEEAFRVSFDRVDEEGRSVGGEAASVPVFLEPRVARAVPVLATSLLAYRTLSFAVGNEGTAHFVAAEVELVATSESGKRVFSAELPPSYVLARSQRHYSVDLPESACRAANVEVVVDTGRKRLTFPLGRPRCTS